MESIVETVPNEGEAIRAVDAKSHPRIARQYDVGGVRAVLIFEDGAVSESVVGMVETILVQAVLQKLSGKTPNVSGPLIHEFFEFVCLTDRVDDVSRHFVEIVCV